MFKTSKKANPPTPSDIPISPLITGTPKQDFRFHPYQANLSCISDMSEV